MQRECFDDLGKKFSSEEKSDFEGILERNEKSSRQFNEYANSLPTLFL